MSQAVPWGQFQTRVGWESGSKDTLLEKINALMLDAGVERAVPPRSRGGSGVVHNFTMKFVDGNSQIVVDVYDRVSAVEVIATYIKVMDTGSVGRIVSKAEPTDFALELSSKYGMALDTASDIDELFAATLG